MRANTDELADRILDIIERHIRLDPDDEGDPGEAARRIIEDIIAPIANGEDMTTIDHAAEARKHIDWAHEIQGQEGQTDRAVTDDALPGVTPDTVFTVLEERKQS